MAKPWVKHVNSNDSGLTLCGMKKQTAQPPDENRVMCYACGMVLANLYSLLLRNHIESGRPDRTFEY